MERICCRGNERGGGGGGGAEKGWVTKVFKIKKKKVC